MKSKKILVIGVGITGITLAERFASAGNKVFIIEKRRHIGGNCYDFKNKAGILVHKYGPHIFHTNYEEVWDYLSEFTNWIPYKHKVLGFIDEKLVPIPFNLNSLYKLFSPDKAKKLEDKLIKKYGFNKKIPMLEFKKEEDKNLKFLANFVYQKIYLGYTQKQWDRKPEEIDDSIITRVPVVISYDKRYFQDEYQGIPKEGYTKMFEKMLKHKNIKIKLNTDYKKIKDKIKYDLMFYTGPIDEFFDYKFGKLEYRYLRIKFKTFNKENYQTAPVINYPDLKYPFTRITEFKKLTQQKHKKTIIGIEYPGEKGFMAWPFLDNKNKKKFERYYKETKKVEKKNIYFAGRLAEYKSYNMDITIRNVLKKIENLII